MPLTTTRTARTSYLLKDPTRWGTETRDAKGKELENFAQGKKFTTTNDKWGNGAVSHRDSAAVDAQYGITKTLDFYKKTFGRKGIANNGKAARGMVHFGNKVANAFWDSTCGCMLYGDGDGDMFKKPLVVLDVTGHELTHGVVDATAKLEPTRVDADGNQYGEAGSLNESLADIFGSNVEFSANNAKNPPNYLIGEKLGLAQKFLRRLDHPSLDKLEGTIDYWSPQTYDAEVHAGSGVSSHAYYLLAEGSGRKTIGGFAYDSPTYDGSTVTGIGRTKATAIFYRALTRYMVSTTDFHDARLATLKAAADLYGANSAAYKTVDKAWAAVNVTVADTLPPGTDEPPGALPRAGHPDALGPQIHCFSTSSETVNSASQEGQLALPNTYVNARATSVCPNSTASPCRRAPMPSSRSGVAGTSSVRPSVSTSFSSPVPVT